MRRIRLYTLLLSVVMAMALTTIGARGETVGLVLSGGGAKGVAHIGVIKALEDNDIPIDYVAGTSMGAVIGSLYSCAFAPDEMLRLIESNEFWHWSTGQVNNRLLYYFDRAMPTPKIIGFQVNMRDSTKIRTSIMPASLISPIPMNIAFLELFSPYTKQCGGNFDRLMVPFRCVTSDVYHKRKIVCRSGLLSEAVRASMSFPGVYKPIRMDGVLVFDGGIYDNFPVDVMEKDFHPDFMIGVAVSGPSQAPEQGNLISQFSDMIIQNNDYSMPDSCSVKINVPVRRFGVLDFDKAQEIYDIGYATGLAMVDSIKRRISARMPKDSVNVRRRHFRSRTPEVLFDSVDVSGCLPVQRSRISRMFTHNVRTPLTLPQVRDSYYAIISSGKVSDLYPTLGGSLTAPYSILDVKATVKDNLHFGVGGWLTTSVNSMIYLSGGYSTLGRPDIDATVHLWAGQSYMAAMLASKRTLSSMNPASVSFTGAIARQKYYVSEPLFYQNDATSSVIDIDGWLRLEYDCAVGRGAKAYGAASYGWMRDKFLSETADGWQRDKSLTRGALVTAGYDYNTLDFDMYPASGSRFAARLFGLFLESMLLEGGHRVPESHYRHVNQARLTADWQQYFPLNRYFAVGTRICGAASIGCVNQDITTAQMLAPAFAPTPSTEYYFNTRFRSNNYVAAGVSPVWMPITNLQVRGSFNVFADALEMRGVSAFRTEYGRWFRRAAFIGEVSGVYNFPFASLSVYVNYLSHPARNWNFGLSFGLNFRAPRFIH